MVKEANEETWTWNKMLLYGWTGVTPIALLLLYDRGIKRHQKMMLILQTMIIATKHAPIPNNEKKHQI